MSVWDDIPWSRSRAAEIREQVTGPGETFGSGDDPIGSQSPMVQKSLVQNLQTLMVRQTEGADQTTSGLQGEFSTVEIDPTISYDENVTRIKQAGDGTGFESEERDRRQRRRDEAQKAARDAAVEYLVDECMRLEEEAGVDGIESLQAAGDGRVPAVPGGEQLHDDVADMIGEFGFTVVTEAMDRCREMSRPDRGIEPDAAGVAEDQLLERMSSVLGQRPASIDDGFARIEQRISNEREDARQNFLNRLSFAFSQNFDSVDDAVERIRDRIDTLAQLDVRSGDIELVGRRDLPPRVSMEAGFATFQDEVTAQVEDAIDLTHAEANTRSGRFDAGTIRVVGDEPQIIDLSPLAVSDRFRVKDPDALVRRFETAVTLPSIDPEVDPETAVAEPQRAETEGDQLADQLLEGVYAE